MHLTRRTRAAAIAATLSAALVVAMAGTAYAVEDLDCGDFTYQEEAQAVLDASPVDSHRLDDNDDGVACETLERRASAPDDEDGEASEPTAPETTPPAAPVEVAAAGTDRDCPDFATQADAQAALERSDGDPERLDADDDGIACENHFGTEGRQVAVFPLGGVSTGGNPIS